MTDPTDLDLFRLGIFSTLHNGHLPNVPRGVVDTYRRLESSGLVTLTDDEIQIPHGCDVDNMPVLDARITESGREVAGAMLGAGRRLLGDMLTDPPLDSNRPGAKLGP